MAVVINGNGTVTGIAVGGLPDGIVDNGTMADDAVAIADLAATGTASSTTFLRGDNSWQAAGGGAWELVTSTDTGTSTYVDFTVSSTYDVYAITFSSISSQYTAKILRLDASINAGSSWLASNEYSWHLNKSTYQSASYAAEANAAQGWGINLTKNGGGMASGIYSMSGTLYFYKPSDAVKYKQLSWCIPTHETTGGYESSVNIGAGMVSTTSAINKLRFKWSSGDFAGAGTIRLYGIKNS